MSDGIKPAVLVYRSKLLRFSETFILAQAQSLRKFRPFLVGVNRVKGLAVPENSVFLRENGHNNLSVSTVLYKVFGPNRSDLAKLRQYDPKLIHAHFGPDGAEAMPIARALGIPLVTTLHGYDATTTDGYFPKDFHHALYKFRRRKLRQQGFYFIAVSNFIYGKLLGQGFPPDRIRVHYIGIDTDQFRPDPQVQREPIVLFVGRLTEKKGCHLLVRAMEIVQRTAPQMKLVVVGDGPLRNRLEEQCRRTLSNYSFIGVQNPSQVCNWMQRSTVFSVPSISSADWDAEGFGMVFAEAQACGLPVVSFASGGVPDAVADGVTGLLAPEGNYQVLGEYLLKLTLDGELWNKFSLAGQARVRERFDIRKQTLLLEEIYSDVISKWKQGGR